MKGVTFCYLIRYYYYWAELYSYKDIQGVGPDRIPADMLKTKGTFSMKVVLFTLRSKIENSYKYSKLGGLGSITLIHIEGEEENLYKYRAITIELFWHYL